MLAKFIFGGLVMIRQFTKFSFPPKFVVIRYINTMHLATDVHNIIMYVTIPCYSGIMINLHFAHHCY